jgi:hypothetical protein
MDPSEMREAMDACRAGSDDLGLPELAQVADSLAADSGARRVFDRIQRLDKRIAAAAHDVPVPAGLAERILARLPNGSALATNGSLAAETAAATESISTETAAMGAAGLVAPAAAQVAPAAALGRLRFSKRALSLAGLAASLLIAVGLVAFWPPHKPLSAAALIDNSGDWTAQLAERASWEPLTERELAKYPAAEAVRARPQSWSNASSLVGEDAVVYDVSTAGHRAYLFVIPSVDPVAGPAPSSIPQSSTHGLMIGCWQSQGMVYVLVVEGDVRAYQNLINLGMQPPLA